METISDESQRTLVAELGGSIVGFVTVGRIRRGPHGVPGDAAQTGTRAELYAIYLLESHVGLGIGRALMRAGEGAMRDLGADHAVLWVLRSNTNTHRFYEACGWHADGEATTYRIGDEDLPVVRYAREL